MAVIKNKTTEENRRFWSHVEEVAREVQAWPDWTRKDAEQQTQNLSAVPSNLPKHQNEPPAAK